MEAGAPYLIVSDRAAGDGRAPVPTALAAGAVHHRLLEGGLRSQTSIIVDADEPRESHHVACLLTNGADAVCPRLALESIVDLAANGRLGGDVAADEAQSRYFTAIEDGLLKIMSKMGISTLDSYRAAQIIEAIGLAPEVMDLCFTGVASALGGLALRADRRRRPRSPHDSASRAKPVLAHPGSIKFKKGGEYHALNPDVIDALHEVVGLNEDTIDVEAAEMAAAHALQTGRQGQRRCLRPFLGARRRTARRPNLGTCWSSSSGATPVPLEEVEDVYSITRRFSTGRDVARSAVGRSSRDACSGACNMIGGMANSGEGGEDSDRFLDDRNCSIKQVASGRFGVTPYYLASATELQIKMAQGSKPGEGGQLPGKKVSVEIARLRHTVPGVALISPPPHHDIYSIEDLAQLIFDLKQANPSAKVSVKLVSSEGVGTIAAGVVKGLADVVHIAGADGGTGASPLSSIKNAGMPWEIGLAETQAALVQNGLRGRARIRVDGGLKNGRDIVIAALLGADEFSFGTIALVAEGCILVRTCHRDTCPVGIATQNPELRKKFAGTPEMVARYLLLLAEEVRGLLASLGLRSLDEAIGRSDLLQAADNRRPARRFARPVPAPRPGRRRRRTDASPGRFRSSRHDRPWATVSTTTAMPALEKGDGVDGLLPDHDRGSDGGSTARVLHREGAMSPQARGQGDRPFRGRGRAIVRSVPLRGDRAEPHRRGERLRLQVDGRRPRRRSSRRRTTPAIPTSSATRFSTAPPAASSSSPVEPASGSACATRGPWPSSKAPAITRAST